MMHIVLFVLCLFHKTDQISESNHLNRSKANSHFLEEFKRKSEDDFGNSIGNKMKSKFQRKNKNTFLKAKKKGKSTKFLGKFISLPNENSWKVWSKLKSGIRILWNLSWKRKRRMEKKKKGTENFYFKSGAS